MSLCFGTSFGEFLFIEPLSISMIKCLALNQLKMIPKNVKNHSNCASGITSSTIGQNSAVNSDTHEWTYRKWMLTRVPCCHAFSVMKFVNVDPVNFISFWYKKETYVEVYHSVIYPLNGVQVWERTEMPDVVPPPTKNMSGRPKKKIRLESWEVT